MQAPSFAQRQLEKYGWKKGQGLGKEKKGINKAIGISVKDDTNGVCVEPKNHTLVTTNTVINL